MQNGNGRMNVFEEDIDPTVRYRRQWSNNMLRSSLGGNPSTSNLTAAAGISFLLVFDVPVGSSMESLDAAEV